MLRLKLSKLKANFKKNFWVHLFLLSLLVNIFGVFVIFQDQVSMQEGESFESLQKKYPLLSKRTLLELPQDALINFLDLRRDLRSKVDHYGNTFGFYFEYLPTGTSIGVNEKQEFHAASLFKTPVVMAYYRTRERLKRTDDPLVELTEKNLDSQFGNLWQKGAGYKLRLSEAVRLSLEESDNTAARLLVPFTENEDFEAVYQGLDIDFNLDGQGAIVTTKSYTSILKALYFAAVLDKEDSNEILDYLTHTKFPDKLAAGIPSDVIVAHKIGDFLDKDGNEAFTDCGIVYVPRRPYTLCMLSTTDEQVAKERMQYISKTVYDYISSINGLPR